MIENKGWCSNSTLPDDKSGIATFVIDGIEHTIRFDDFKDYLKVCEMIEIACHEGQKQHAFKLDRDFALANRVQPRMRVYTLEDSDGGK